MARTSMQTEIANHVRRVFRAQYPLPATEVPVNLMAWVDRLDAHLVRARLDGPGFHGAVAEQPASGVVMLVNGIDDFRVQRFTIAHELGHILLHHHRKAQTYWWFETEANTVASEILLPWSYLEHVVRPTIPLDPEGQVRWWAQMGSALARHAAVTESVVAYHLQDLGWLSLPVDEELVAASALTVTLPAWPAFVPQSDETRGPRLR